MERLYADKIAEWINGELVGNAKAVADKVSMDARTLKQKSLFFAVQKTEESYPANIEQVLNHGAAIIVSEKNYPVPDKGAVILVKNTVEALGDLARCYIKTLNIPVVAITGSGRLTPVKEMIAHVLSTEYNVYKTTRYSNQPVDICLAALKMTRDHSAAVFELDLDDKEDIQYISDIIRPDIGVITNIASRKERIDSRQDNLRAKLGLTHGMKENGRLILNGDDKLLCGLNGLLSMPVVFYGIDETLSLHAYGIESLGETGVTFTVILRNEEVKMMLPASGIIQVSNALAAVACGLELGVPNRSIQKGLSGDYQCKQERTLIQNENVMHHRFSIAMHTVFSECEGYPGLEMNKP